MKATEAKFLEFLKKSPQFVIPIYQRTYSWTEQQCMQLWDDIIRAGSDTQVPAHFMGSIVYIEKDLYQVSNSKPLLVIDGQQRLTTVTILLAALAQYVDGLDENKREPIDGFSPKKIRNYYLLNPEEEGEKKHKLILSQTDKDTLISVVNNSDLPKEFSIRVKENYELFQDLIQKNGDELTIICNGLLKLMVVDIALSRGQDNPQLIFESMNSTGKELSQADLIRNYILMGLEPEFQTELYEKYWRPMELDFGQEAYGTHFDAYMRYFLTVKMGEIPNINNVYEEFKNYSRRREIATLGVEALVKDIRETSKYFCAMALDGEKDSELKIAFADLRELKVDVAYPFLLSLYADYKANVLSKDDFITIVRLIESYVFRRAVCNIQTNSMNKTFGNFAKSVNKDHYLESVEAHFALMPSYRRFPSDEEFKRDIKLRNLYNFPRQSYWLRRLENFDRKERVYVEDYTIEHIMPQNERLSSAWKTALGDNWKEIQEKYLHTLGNLTLTGYNSEYSDKSFQEKRDMDGGFKDSPLRVNEGLASLEKWDEKEIVKRADKLANKALKVWVSLDISEADLAKYKEKDKEIKEWSIEDHPHLLGGPVRELFEIFRTEVKRLDPSVIEEFKKLYIAYKAETNFVDVVPQAKRLRLTLNMPFSELRDSKGIAIDVSGKGRWGNGDVQVGISSKEELPYVIGLVRQALERQMDY